LNEENSLIHVLDRDILLVKGAKKSCIYDLRNYYLDLYWVDNSFFKQRNWNEKISKLLGTNSIQYSSFKNKHHYEYITKTKNKTASFSNLLNFAWVEITSVCNLNCEYCYLRRTKTYIDKTTFIHILSFLEKLGCNRIQLIGGEPFCHPNILHFLDISLNRGFKVSIYTNGTLLDKTIIEHIAKLNIKVNIGIPVGNHKLLEIIKSNISLCKEKGILNKVSATITKHNINFDFKAFLSDAYKLLKTDIVRISSPHGLLLYNKPLLERKLITLEYFKQKRKSIAIRRNIKHHNCFSNKIYISSNLELYPCPMVRKISIGNLSNLNIRKFLDNYTSLTTLTKDRIFFCRKCEFRYACFDCRYDTWGKNPFNRPWYCTYNPLTGKWIQKDVYLEKYLLRRMNMEDIILLTNKEDKTHETTEVEACAPGYCGPVEE